MALRRQIVDFVRARLLDDVNEAAGVRHVSMMQKQARPRLMRVPVEMIDTVRVEQRRPAPHAVHDIVFLEQKLGKIRPVLTCNPGYQCCLALHIGHHQSSHC
jgi:hypothetical protein